MNKEITSRDNLLRLRDQTRARLDVWVNDLKCATEDVYRELGNVPTTDGKVSDGICGRITEAFNMVQRLNGQLTGIRDALEVTA